MTGVVGLASAAEQGDLGVPPEKDRLTRQYLPGPLCACPRSAVPANQEVTHLQRQGQHRVRNGKDGPASASLGRLHGG